MDVVDSLPAVIFSVSLTAGDKLVFDSCNKRVETFFAITPSQIAADADIFFRLIAESEREKIKAALIGAIKSSSEFSSEIEFVTHTGESIWMLLRTTPLANKAALCGALTDITDIHNSKADAISAVNYYLHLQDQLSDLFYFKDRNSIFKGGNKAWYTLHGFSRLEDAIGKTDVSTGVFSKEAAARIFEQEQEMMQTGTPIHEREKHVHDDGTISYADSKKVPLYGSDGEIIGLVGLTRDVTKVVQTEMALEKAKEDAEQAAKAKSSFLAVMSHEIRTPMNGVIGCASLLASTQLTSEQQQLVSTIQNSGESLLVLINDILDYSKIEAGKINLEHSPFQLRLLIEDCIELFSKQAADKRLEINYYIEPEVPLSLNGDANRIRQVINNLLGNAIKFTEQGEVFVDVSLANIDTPHHRCGLVIAIRDTGIGISEDSKANLFNAFTQADNSITRKFGGTGLGLVICKKIVEQMDGEIWFTSILGRGTTFYVELSLDFEIQDNDGGIPHEVREFKGLRVLIVDDNTTNRKVLASTVIQWGMVPAAFQSAESTLENLAFGHQYDLVLLDFCMPKTNGCDLAKKIKQLPHMHDKPIIILSSANTQQEDLHDVDASLLKPVRNSVLQKAVAQVLGKAGTQRATHANLNNIHQERDTRILIVEDNTVNQMVIAMMLKKLGYNNFSSVADGEEAVEQCQKMAFDIIFMDIQMLRMDGYTASKLIRQQNHHAKQPWIIALTAGAQKEDSEKAFAAGMNAFTTKPIQLEGLKAVLDSAESALQRDTKAQPLSN